MTRRPHALPVLGGVDFDLPLSLQQRTRRASRPPCPPALDASPHRLLLLARLVPHPVISNGAVRNLSSSSAQFGLPRETSAPSRPVCVRDDRLLSAHIRHGELSLCFPRSGYLNFQLECNGRLSNGFGLVHLSSGRKCPRESQWRVGFPWHAHARRHHLREP